MKITPWIIIILLVLILSGTACNRSDQPTLEPTPQTPLPPVFPTQTEPAYFTATPHFVTVTPAETEASPLPEAEILSKPLFLLADKAVWIIHPGEAVVQRLTPPELKVTCFDVWPKDNSMVYGTDTGQVYLVQDTSQIGLTILPEDDPVMLFDAFPDAPYLVRMDSVSWSPDGARLAFTVDYSSPGAPQTAGYPSQPSGLWLFELPNQRATWVESNHYLGSNQSDPLLVRRLSVANWSPDSTGLIVHTISQNGKDTLFLDTQDQANLLIDPPGDFWGSASWKRDSQTVLLSGAQKSSTSHLLQVQRDGSGLLTLIDGNLDELYVYDATELPAGIAFLANCPGCSPDQTKLYFGHHAGNRFVYTGANISQTCQSGYPRHVQWDLSGQTGALICGPGELRVFQFQVDNVVELDLSSFLRPLGGAEVLKLAWGGG
jgi:hypothetical protein